jgi:chorismate synthase
VVGEGVVAFELANAVLEKFGGDALPETSRNLDGYLETLP